MIMMQFDVGCFESLVANYSIIEKIGSEGCIVSMEKWQIHTNFTTLIGILLTIWNFCIPQRGNNTERYFENSLIQRKQDAYYQVFCQACFSVWRQIVIIMQASYLPEELACRLIELEVGMQQQSGLNRQSILELLDCYTRAVEFYNERGDDRRNIYYQRKMQDFLQRPAITEVLQQGKKSDLTLRKEKNQEEVRKISNQSQQVVKQIMESSKEETIKQKLFLEANLAKQEKTLEERLERKRANSNRIARPKLTSASFACTSSKDSGRLLQSFTEMPSAPRKHP